MNERIGPMYVPDDPEYSYTDEKPYSKALGNMVDEESRKIIREAYLKTEQILKDNRDKLHKVNTLFDPIFSMISKQIILFVYFLVGRSVTRKRDT